MQVQKQIDELLSLRASEWLELLPTATESERSAFAEWLGESRLHVQAFLEVAEIEYSLGGIDPQRKLDVEHWLEGRQLNVLAFGRPPPPQAERPSESDVISVGESSVTEADSQVRTRPRALRMIGAAMALAATISAVVIGLRLLPLQGTRFATAVGEQKTVGLADTSIITLNALSRIEVELADSTRDVDLQEGEAIFNVAHDPHRPFRVHTRAGTVLAVGTQFNVYDRPTGETRVSVLEGRVQLTARTRADGTEGQPVPAIAFLSAGEEADIEPDGTIKRREGAAVSNTVAWRQRRLVFENTALEDIVHEFNRYNPSVHLRVEGVPSGTYRFDGVFDAADPQSLVDLLTREPDLSLERKGEEVVIRQTATGQ